MYVPPDDPIAALTDAGTRRTLLAIADGDPRSSVPVGGEGGGATEETRRVHLPDLAERGIVEYDREAGTVARGPEFDRIEPVLAALSAQRADLGGEPDPAHADLEARVDRLEKFASAASHDLRSPLTTADSYLELARHRHGEIPEVEDAREAIDRAFAVVDDALALARAGDGVVDRDPLSLPSVAEDAWGTVGTNGATLAVEDVGPVAADRDHLRRLFENLFRNCVEHGSTGDRPRSDATGGTATEPDGDRADNADPTAGPTVRVGPLDDRPGFYVADDGPGIPPEIRDSVFEYGVTTGEDGTGLGLATVREIAAAHGWEVTATEAAGGGARFEFVGPELAAPQSPAQDD